jgi:hypothetical protein
LVKSVPERSVTLGFIESLSHLLPYLNTDNTMGKSLLSPHYKETESEKVSFALVAPNTWKSQVQTKKVLYLPQQLQCPSQETGSFVDLGQ